MEDLSLLTSPQQAKIGWQMLGALKIAGDWTQLKKTRMTLQASKMGYESALDLEYERRILLRKLDYVACAMLSQHMALVSSAGGGLRGSFRLSKVSPIHNVAEDDAKQMQQYLIYVLNAKGNKLPPPTTLHMYVPKTPSLRKLLSWTPQDVETFLLNCKGDLADKGNFRKYAKHLREHEVTGTTLEQLTPDLMAQLGVAIGDRMPLIRALKVLAMTYNHSATNKQDIRISVLDAAHLPRMDALGTCDAYVELRMQDGPSYMEYRSSIVRNNYNPIWSGQHHTFKVRNVEDPGQLTIMVYDNDRVSKDDCVGAHLLQEVFEMMPGLNPDDVQAQRHSLKEILAKSQRSTQTFKLFKNGKPVIGEDNHQAQVRLAFEFIHMDHGPLSVEVVQGDYPRLGVGGRHKIMIYWHEDSQERTPAGSNTLARAHYDMSNGSGDEMRAAHASKHDASGPRQQAAHALSHADAAQRHPVAWEQRAATGHDAALPGDFPLRNHEMRLSGTWSPAQQQHENQMQQMQYSPSQQREQWHMRQQVKQNQVKHNGQEQMEQHRQQQPQMMHHQASQGMPYAQAAASQHPHMPQQVDARRPHASSFESLEQAPDPHGDAASGSRADPRGMHMRLGGVADEGMPDARLGVAPSQQGSRVSPSQPVLQPRLASSPGQSTAFPSTSPQTRATTSAGSGAGTKAKRNLAALRPLGPSDTSDHSPNRDGHVGSSSMVQDTEAAMHGAAKLPSQELPSQGRYSAHPTYSSHPTYSAHPGTAAATGGRLGVGYQPGPEVYAAYNGQMLAMNVHANGGHLHGANETNSVQVFGGFFGAHSPRGQPKGQRMRNSKSQARREAEEALDFEEFDEDAQADNKHKAMLAVNTDYTQNAAQRVGRQLAAEIDNLMVCILPVVFICYVGLEFDRIGKTGGLDPRVILGEKTSEFRSQIEMVDKRGLLPGDQESTCNLFHVNKAIDPALSHMPTSRYFKNETACDKIRSSEVASLGSVSWVTVVIAALVALFVLTLCVFFRYILMFCKDLSRAVVSQRRSKWARKAAGLQVDDHPSRPRPDA